MTHSMKKSKLERLKSSVQFSSVPWLIGSSGEHEGRSSRDPLPAFFCRRPLWAVLAWAGMFTLWCVHPAFPLLTTASPTFQRALKDGFGDAVETCDVSESCKFPSLDSCQKGFLRTNKEVDLAPRRVVSLVLQVGDAEKFPHTFSFESLNRFSESASRVHASQP